MADIYLNKTDLETDFYFDTVVTGNDLEKDNTILTATIISIFTDASKPYIGNVLNNSNIYGNKHYNIKKLSDDNIKLYEKGIKDSIKWLIDDGLVVSNEVVVTRVKSNMITVYINQFLEDDTSVNVIYSLDENMEILDDIR